MLGLGIRLGKLGCSIILGIIILMIGVVVVEEVWVGKMWLMMLDVDGDEILGDGVWKYRGIVGCEEGIGDDWDGEKWW